VYTINIDHLDSSGPITELDQAREAVAGTEITVIEADGIEGAWLAELPKDLIDEMRSLGSFDLQNGEYAIFGDWSE
jgi:hypothetical protein